MLCSAPTVRGKRRCFAVFWGSCAAIRGASWWTAHRQAYTLVMDEPTASLDYGNQTLVLARASALAREGYTVILSTHNPQHALWYADAVLALQNGRSVAFGAPGEVMNSDLLQRLYGVRTALLQTESGPLVVPLMKGREGGAEDG